MLRTVEATLEPEGTITFSEQLHLTSSQKVLVTLLGEAGAPEGGAAGHVAQVLALLQRPDFRNRPAGSAAALDEMIATIRDAWDG